MVLGGLGLLGSSPAAVARPAADELGSARSRAVADPVGGPRMGENAFIIDRPAGVPPPPAFPVTCFVLADLDNGGVLAAQCPHRPALPASALKVLTALALEPVLAPTQSVSATDEDAAIDGTKVGMVAGSAYTVRQLFFGLLMTSGNDAAQALARAAGGMPEAARLMNDEARRLGALDTRAVNSSGLDAPGQVTSAYDLALFGRELLRRGPLVEYVSRKTLAFPGARVRGGGTSRRPTFEIGNHNKLLWNYEGAIGVKNGYTVAAKHTYIGAARRDEKSYLVSYVGGTSGDWRSTAALLDWAFAYGERLRPVGTLVEPGSVDSADHPIPAMAPGAAATPSLSASEAPALDGPNVLTEGGGDADEGGQEPGTEAQGQQEARGADPGDANVPRVHGGMTGMVQSVAAGLGVIQDATGGLVWPYGVLGLGSLGLLRAMRHSGRRGSHRA